MKFITIFCLFIFCSFNVYAEDNLKLFGGDKGDISFPHKLHQENLKDCNLCHKSFPKEKGSIQKLIGEEKLLKKTVMQNCLNCHRKMASEGQKTGPTACSKCHQK